MAYISKEQKAILVAKVKEVLPKGWKATFSVRYHCSFVVTIKQSPFDFFDFFPGLEERHTGEYFYGNINPHNYERLIKDKELAGIIGKIIDAMNFDNYNNSDVMTDYFDVGHYIDLQVGSYKKDYVKS